MAQPTWNTPAGSLGGFSSGTIISPVQLSATPILPATSLSYAIISGSLPSALGMTTAGLIYGLADAVYENTTYPIVVRVTDNLGNIRDRSFTLTLSGVEAPAFVTPSGNILTTEDSNWIELQVEYTSPIPNTEILVRLIQGSLPPGLEVNEYGLIRGYPSPPFVTVTTESVNTASIKTLDNAIVCYSTLGFTVGRPVVFSGSTIGGIVGGTTYYVHSVIDSTSFNIATTVNGSIFPLTDEEGYMLISLSPVSVGQPTISTYDFTLKLESAYGSSIKAYNIVVVNQNAPISIGGPQRPTDTRIPTLLNTRPLTYQYASDQIDYSYYLLPSAGQGVTYTPDELAYIGKFSSDNQFSFRLLGCDFDGDQIEYVFTDLPPDLTGDSTSGWIIGNPIIASNSISQFGFKVAARKKLRPTIISPDFNFSFTLKNTISGDINWLTPANLGTVYNDTVSVLSVQAYSDVSLEYELTSGALPPNLILLSTGELSGTVAFQPTGDLLNQNETSDFTFTIRAFSPQFPVVNTSRTFNLSVKQEFANPMDSLYVKCTPSIADRQLINSLLSDTTLIPDAYLYRSDDSNFGKASDVVYEHAYGINASNIDEYAAAVTKNHYWRNITLGQIGTSVARNQNTGEVVYEVVYSSVYDNLVNYNEVDSYTIEQQTNVITPQGESVAKEIIWPRPIPPSGITVVYPNSLPNMRQQVVDVLGQEQNTNILPLWMTSQQLNGSSLGFTPAWVICYCLPRIIVDGQALTYAEFAATGLNRSLYKSYAEQIAYDIQNNWKDPAGQSLALNLINFKIDRFIVDKSTTYNYDNNLTPPQWINLPSATPPPNPVDSQNFYVWFPQITILPE